MKKKMLSMTKACVNTGQKKEFTPREVGASTENHTKTRSRRPGEAQLHLLIN